MLAAWRATQGIYVFDSDVRRDIWNTPVSGDIPSDVLFHLPEASEMLFPALLLSWNAQHMLLVLTRRRLHSPV
jgi:hypothetical protein